jgi:hypothetical protein
MYRFSVLAAPCCVTLDGGFRNWVAVRVWVGGGEFKDRVLWVDWRVWRVAFGAVLGCMQVGVVIGGMRGAGRDVDSMGYGKVR